MSVHERIVSAMGVPFVKYAHSASWQISPLGAGQDVATGTGGAYVPLRLMGFFGSAGIAM
jgi:hypothetical protein